MGVLVEAFSLVIRNATFQDHLPGGVKQYERDCPNGTFCSDGVICRVGFMSLADAMSYLGHLRTMGFVPPTSDGSPEVAIVEGDSGFLFPCDWLQLTRLEGVAIAWLKGTELTHYVAPPGWEGGTMVKLTPEELNERYELVEVKDRLEVYRHRETGEPLYIGRPRIPSRRKWWQVWK